MIEIKDMHFQYPRGEFTLDVPELNIKKGEKVAFAGPSGCGKTTLVYLIAGILAPDYGCISVDDADLKTQSDVQRRKFRITKIGFIFQDFELLEYLTTRENILLPYLVNRSIKPTSEVLSRVKNVAASVGLGKFLSRYPRELSQGEKQRVAICRALITRPGIIIADEPTGNLDLDNTSSIMQIMLDQVRQRDATFIMVTHDHSLFDRFDRVVEIRDFAKGGVK